MVIKAIIFDVNGTLTDIRTTEWDDNIYRIISNLLSYQGIVLDAEAVKYFYFQSMKEQRIAAGEHHAEFDAVGIFRDMISRHMTEYTRNLPVEKLEQLPGVLAETYRAASRQQLHLYPGVEITIRQLHQQYRLGVITDGQTAYAVPELHAVGMSRYFDTIIVSGDYGYRKPDARLFQAALTAMNLQPTDVLYVGNDMYRDIYGAQRLGIKTVFFKSNQGVQDKDGVNPDYIIYSFPELLDAVRYFEASGY